MLCANVNNAPPFYPFSILHHVIASWRNFGSNCPQTVDGIVNIPTSNNTRLCAATDKHNIEATSA